MSDELFDTGEVVEPEVREGLAALKNAHELDVPYPFDEPKDLALLRRIKGKYPDLDVNALVQKFVTWCTDATPWQDEKGKAVPIRWRSRLWTWAVNDERYGASGRGGTGRAAASRTHYAATAGGHGDDTWSSDKW